MGVRVGRAVGCMGVRWVWWLSLLPFCFPSHPRSATPKGTHSQYFMDQESIAFLYTSAGPKFEKFTKYRSNKDLKILSHAENYKEDDGTIAGPPNLQKVSVFDEILMDKKRCCAALDLQVPVILPKSIPKTPKKATA